MGGKQVGNLLLSWIMIFPPLFQTSFYCILNSTMRDECHYHMKAFSKWQILINANRKQCDNSFKLGKSTEATWQLVRCPLCAESDQIPQCTTTASTYEIKLKPNNLDVICDSFAWRQSTRAETFSSQLPSLYCLASVGPEPPTPPSDQHHVTAKAENVPSYPMCCQFEWQDGDRLSHVCSFKQIT